MNGDEPIYSKSGRFYDKIYSFKDYHGEAQHLVSVIRQNFHSGDIRVLDVACGTGRHLEYLKEHFEVAGLDLSEELLEVARSRNPGVDFHRGDMLRFDLPVRFEVVTCLFGAIGYVRTVENLGRAVHNMTQHLVPGGIVLIEPWFTPETWQPGTVHARFIDEPEFKLARVNTSFTEGRLSCMDMHYLIGTPEGTGHFVERHELGLFTAHEMEAVLESAGLMVTYDQEGLAGRGLYLGKKGQKN